VPAEGNTWLPPFCLERKRRRMTVLMGMLAEPRRAKYTQQAENTLRNY
jgi:hypothetical protein